MDVDIVFVETNVDSIDLSYFVKRAVSINFKEIDFKELGDKNWRRGGNICFGNSYIVIDKFLNI